MSYNFRMSTTGYKILYRSGLEVIRCRPAHIISHTLILWLYNARYFSIKEMIMELPRNSS